MKRIVPVLLLAAACGEDLIFKAEEPPPRPAEAVDVVSDGVPTGEIRTCAGMPGCDQDRDGIPDIIDHCPQLYNIRPPVGADLSMLECKDTDGDGLLDRFDLCELLPYVTLEDHDGDGLLDIEEQPAENLDREQFWISPCERDSDFDNSNDLWEIISCSHSDHLEGCLYSDPTNPDTDGDGILDGDDICPRHPGTVEDPDGDGVPTEEELAWVEDNGPWSEPCLRDTDKDGLHDGEDPDPRQPRGSS